MSRPISSRRRGRAGFTLIEMVVASLLLAIGVTAALAAYATSARATGSAEQHNTAALLAQRHLTELETQTDLLSSGQQQGDFSPDFPEYRWQRNIEGTDFEDLFKVTVTIQWGDAGSPSTRVFTTYARQPQNQQQNRSSSASSSNSGQSGASSTGTAH